MEVRGPEGEMRWLKHPWSVLAFQIAGADGLRVLHADGKDEERETPPAEPLVGRLALAAPGRGAGDPGADRRGADVRPREGRH